MSQFLLGLLLFAAGSSTLSATPSEACAVVIGAERARGNALINGDLTTLEDLLSDDLLYTHSNGRRQTKQDVLDDLKSGKAIYTEFRLSDLEPRQVDDNVVVVNGRIDQAKTTPTGNQQLMLLFQSVWRLENVSWRLVALQTVLPPPKKTGR